MVKNTKAKGSRNELKSKALLESVGFDVTKSGGSLGTWDLIALGPIGGFVVQVKSNRRPGALELEAIREAQVPPNFMKLIHVWKDGSKWPECEVVP